MHHRCAYFVRVLQANHKEPSVVQVFDNLFPGLRILLNAGFLEQVLVDDETVGRQGVGKRVGLAVEDLALVGQSETPYEGYMGDPSKGRGGVNEGKRTSIYPEPLTKWAAGFASASNLTDAPVETLIEEIKAGHVVLLYATSGWNAPSWEVYPWSITEKGEVTNNHCVCVVGVYEDGSILINDCGYHLGEYKVSAKKFKSIYEARGFAVSVY